MNSRARSTLLLGAVLWTVAAIGAACGSSGSNGATASSTPTPVTIRISPSGVDVQSVSVSAGTQVLFLNEDTASHQIQSDPHPQHTDCVELNGPVLGGGERFLATMSAHAQPCGFHDEMSPQNPSFQGSVAVTLPDVTPTPRGSSTPTASPTVSITPSGTETATPVPTATDNRGGGGSDAGNG